MANMTLDHNLQL